jgi:fructose-bisphosphate aldolase class II
VRKINIDTDIRLAMTGAVRKFLAENPEKFDAREWLKPAREAAKKICKQRYIEFGCEGQAGKIKGESLQVVAAKYAKGELAQSSLASWPMFVAGGGQGSSSCGH